MGKYDIMYNFVENLARVKKGDKWGFIDRAYNEHIVYDFADDFQEGFARVKKGDKWGFVDIFFNEYSIEYDIVDNFCNGFTRVEKNGKWYFLNKEFKKSRAFELCGIFSDLGFACVIENDKKKIIDRNFRVVKYVIGYKGTDKDMICRGFRYELKKKYKINDKIILCENGFHFCLNLNDVFEYYPSENGNRFFKVKVEVNENIDFDNNKLVSDNIEFLEEIKI